MPLLEAVLEVESGRTGLSVRIGGMGGWELLVIDSSEGGRGAWGSGGVDLCIGSSLMASICSEGGILLWHFLEVM